MKFFNWSKKKESKTQAIDDNNYQFMLTGRAHGLLALWATERMGKTSEAAANYTDEIVSNVMSDEQLLAKLNEDLVFHEQNIEQQEIAEKLKAFRVVAKLELDDEIKRVENRGNC